ncbi:MAG: NAD(P)-dependent oxidoreductase [Veillonella sp.]|uniref:NAD-dependent epimerase/dehydratase family protein n=1 Tax=Veillonella sp. TaxID=1926307 RepID=UPI0025D3A5E2|nr:NAD(P)-dependent oxidoreductase [Veillonella sp.]MBS4913653.1 NAD(P)-dependent oxidoreductase [Veillonella sp.]
MRIAILGASSFIGKQLIESLSLSNHELLAIIREGSSSKDYFKSFESVEIIECNMDKYPTLANQIMNLDCLVYLTWDGTRGSTRDDYEKQENNYKIGLDTIHAFAKNGCKKVVLAGSQAEYGPLLDNKKVTEKDLANPNTEYGKFKLKLYQDALVLAEKYSFTLIEPRFFSLYGPDDYEGTMIISVLQKMLKNLPCDLTECIQIWDFLYIDDAIDALVTLIVKKNNTGIYNFGSGESHKLKYYIECMKNITKSQSVLNYGVIPYPKTGMVNVNPSVEKLKSIGWLPKVKFEDGIKYVLNSIENKMKDN